MSVPHGGSGTSGGGGGDDRSMLWYVLPGALLTLFVLVIVMTWAAISGSGADSGARDGPDRKLPPYWTVRNGQTYSQIAERTGLSVEDLETFNPYTDPTALVPGQRLKLRLHAPPPPPKPLGPRFWTVRTGQTFSLISARSGHSIDRLRRLNPRLNPLALQPGNRVRLRR